MGTPEETGVDLPTGFVPEGRDVADPAVVVQPDVPVGFVPEGPHRDVDVADRSARGSGFVPDGPRRDVDVADRGPAYGPGFVPPGRRVAGWAGRASRRRTSSANPGNLVSYRDMALGQVARWEGLVPGLRDCLEQLRTSLGNFDLPADVDVSVPTLEDTFDTLTRNQRHLDEWVGDVGEEFARVAGLPADGLGHVVSVSNSQIQVGFADRQASERQARQDADRLQQILQGNTGLFSPYDDPERLEELAEMYPELQDFLGDVARYNDDEAYAATLLDNLGSSDVRTLADLTATFGTAEHRGIVDDNTFENYVLPVAGLFAAADRSGRMSNRTRDALLDLDTSDDPAWEDEQGHGVGLSVTADRLRANALILNAGDFTPQTTADVANTLVDTLWSGEYGALPIDFEERGAAYTENAGVLSDRPELASIEWTALEALAGDPEAAYRFYEMDDHANLRYMDDAHQIEGVGTTDSSSVYDLVERRLEEAGLADRFDGRGDLGMERSRGRSLSSGLLDYPAAAGTTYEDDTIDLVSDAVRTAGDRNLSNSVRHQLAEVTTPYTVDIAVAANPSGEPSAAENQDPPRLPDELSPDGTERLMLDVSRGDVNRYLREVSEGHDARVVLARNGAALVGMQIDNAEAEILGGDPNPVSTEVEPVVSYFTELGQAWADVAGDEMQRRAEMVEGWRALSDPVFHVATGGLLERGPIGAVTSAPGVNDVYQLVENDLHRRFDEALYGRLVDGLEDYETMEDWRQEMERSVEISLHRAAYTNENVRQHYIALAYPELSPAEVEARAASIPYAEFVDLDRFKDDANAWYADITNSVLTRTTFGEAVSAQPAAG